MMERLTIPLGIALFWIAACGGGSSLGETADAGPSESSALVLAGATKADFSTDKSGSCGWKPSAFLLTFTTGAVNGVKLDFLAQVGVGGVGDPDAATPPREDGLTPLVVRASGKTIKATSGTIHVTDADVITHAFKGTVEAQLEDGTKVTGSWSCTATLT